MENKKLIAIGLDEALRKAIVDMTTGTAVIECDYSNPGAVKFSNVSLEPDPLEIALKKTFCHEKAGKKEQMPANPCKDKDDKIVSHLFIPCLESSGKIKR